MVNSEDFFAEYSWINQHFEKHLKSMTVWDLFGEMEGKCLSNETQGIKIPVFLLEGNLIVFNTSSS